MFAFCLPQRYATEPPGTLDCINVHSVIDETPTVRVHSTVVGALCREKQAKKKSVRLWRIKVGGGRAIDHSSLFILVVFFLGFLTGNP